MRHSETSAESEDPPSDRKDADVEDDVSETSSEETESDSISLPGNQSPVHRPVPAEDGVLHAMPKLENAHESEGGGKNTGTTNTPRDEKTPSSHSSVPRRRSVAETSEMSDITLSVTPRRDPEVSSFNRPPTPSFDLHLSRSTLATPPRETTSNPATPRPPPVPQVQPSPQMQPQPQAQQLPPVQLPPPVPTPPLSAHHSSPGTPRVLTAKDFDRIWTAVSGLLLSDVFTAQQQTYAKQLMKDLLACYDSVHDQNIDLAKQLREADDENEVLTQDLSAANVTIKQLEQKQTELMQQLETFRQRTMDQEIVIQSTKDDIVSEVQRLRYQAKDLRTVHKSLCRDIRTKLQDFGIGLQNCCFDVAACWSYNANVMEALTKGQKQQGAKANKEMTTLPKASKRPGYTLPSTAIAQTVNDPADRRDPSLRDTTDMSYLRAAVESGTNDAQTGGTRDHSTGRLELSDIATVSDLDHGILQGQLSSNYEVPPAHGYSASESHVSEDSALSQDIPRVQVLVRPKPSPFDPLSGLPATPLTVANNLTMDALKGHERHIFHLDHIYSIGEINDSIAVDMKTISENVLGGRNVCIAAYGESGSGKTYTMQGKRGSDGIISQAISHILSIMEAVGHELPVRATLIAYELLGDKIRDLLSTTAADTVDWVPVTIPTKVSRLELYRENDWTRLCRVLFALRHSRKNTQPGALASRISCVVSLTVESTIPEGVELGAVKGPDRRIASLTFVELPAADIPVHDKELRSKDFAVQLQCIRQTLFTYGDLMGSLYRGRRHLPYRNSKLTCLLQNAIDHRTLMVLIVCVHSGDAELPGTMKSLLYATRIKQTAYTILCDQQSCSRGKEEELRKSGRVRPVAMPVELLNCNPALTLRAQTP